MCFIKIVIDCLAYFVNRNFINRDRCGIYYLIDLIDFDG